MLTPKTFSKKINLSYDRVLLMCKSGEINAIETNGGHFKISEKELDKFLKNDSFISKEEYERVVRENEKLKTMIQQLKNYATNLVI